MPPAVGLAPVKAAVSVTGVPTSTGLVGLKVWDTVGVYCGAEGP